MDLKYCLKFEAHVALQYDHASSATLKSRTSRCLMFECLAEVKLKLKYAFQSVEAAARSFALIGWLSMGDDNIPRTSLCYMSKYIS